MLQIPRRRRGLSLFEVMVAGMIMLWVIALLVAFASVNSKLWQAGVLDSSTQGDAQLAVQAMAPDIRKARSVITGSSSSSKLTLQLPSYDGSGNLVIPIANGDTITYYLSDTTGSTSVTNGTILWRAVNGTAQSSWSLSAGKGKILLSSGGLSFTYYPTSNPETVTVSVTSTSTSGSTTRKFVTTQEVLLRNHGI